jgi:hypothetical protein
MAFAWISSPTAIYAPSPLPESSGKGILRIGTFLLVQSPFLLGNGCVGRTQGVLFLMPIHGQRIDETLHLCWNVRIRVVCSLLSHRVIDRWEVES